MRRVSISNIRVYNADAHFASIISCIPGHEIEDIRLNDITIYYREMDSAFDAIQAMVPENEKQYPEPAKMGILPAYGFFIRHARNLRFDKVTVAYLGKEVWPAFVIEAAKQISLYRVYAKPVAGVASFVLRAVKDFTLQDSAPFLKQTGKDNKRGVVLKLGAFNSGKLSCYITRG